MSVLGARRGDAFFAGQGMAKVGDELRRRRVETAPSGDVSEPRQRLLFDCNWAGSSDSRKIDKVINI